MYNMFTKKLSNEEFARYIANDKRIALLQAMRDVPATDLKRLIEVFESMDHILNPIS